MEPSEIDDELRPVLAAMPEPDFEDLERNDRLMASFWAATPPLPPPEGVKVTDRLLGGVRVRVYCPEGGSSRGRRPAVVWFHGGGFVRGGVGQDDWRCGRLAEAIPAVVVSVEYRLAPHHRFPAALDDGHAVVRALAASPGRLGVDPDRIAVAGESAGACIAAGLALRLRDEGGPPIAFQLLSQPVLDDRLETPSMREGDRAPVWNRRNAAASWRHYLGDRLADPPEYAAPARARSLRGLPPAHVGVAELDPLRDEALAYARRLSREGVPVEVHDQPGACHTYALIAPRARISRTLVERWVSVLRGGLGASGSLSDPR